MNKHPSVELRSFAETLFVALLALWRILVCLACALLLDIFVMAGFSSCREFAVREAIGWFFGNGSDIHKLSWPQMFCCMIAATLGYLFLGIFLGAAMKAFQVADRVKR